MGRLTSRYEKSWEGKKSHPRSQVNVNPNEGARLEGYTVAIAIVCCIN